MRSGGGIVRLVSCINGHNCFFFLTLLDITATLFALERINYFVVVGGGVGGGVFFTLMFWIS